MSVLAIADPVASVADHDTRDPLLRLAQLFDGNDYDLLHSGGDAEVRTAAGRVNGAQVIAYCTDATKMGGAFGAAGSRRIVEAIEIAVRDRCPVLGVWHSGGAKLADGVESMDAVGQMFAAITRASGQIPQISVVVGPAAGAAAYGPALTDLIIMAPAGRVFVTGPDVVRSVTGEEIDMEGLGGPEAHSRRSGVAHMTADSEADAYLRARRLVTFFTRPGLFKLNELDEEEDLRAFLPDSPRRAYDARPLVRGILDSAGRYGGGFDEIQPRWAPNMVIGLGRLAGRTVGVVASNPIRKGGCLDSLSAEKASRFVRTCDAFNIPLLTFVDVPGFMPGTDQEYGGIIRHGAKLLYAYCEATVPRIQIITRKAYGGAYVVMNSKSIGADLAFAWPSAELAVMGPNGAVEIVYRRELAEAADPARRRAELIDEYTERYANPYIAAERGYLDAVIRPAETRSAVTRALISLRTKRETLPPKKHGNIPL